MEQVYPTLTCCTGPYIDPSSPLTALGPWPLIPPPPYLSPYPLSSPPQPVRPLYGWAKVRKVFGFDKPVDDRWLRRPVHALWLHMFAPQLGLSGSLLLGADSVAQLAVEMQVWSVNVATTVGVDTLPPLHAMAPAQPLQPAVPLAAPGMTFHPRSPACLWCPPALPCPSPPCRPPCSCSTPPCGN